jgi:hypothetical protein
VQIRVPQGHPLLVEEATDPIVEGAALVAGLEGAHHGEVHLAEIILEPTARLSMTIVVSFDTHESDADLDARATVTRRVHFDRRICCR